MTYVAVGHGVWGRGDTIKDAIKVARSQGVGRNTKFSVWSTLDREAYVDGMGFLLTDESFPAPVREGVYSCSGKTATEVK